MTAHAVLCADVGSTFTKVAAVDAETGLLYATASHPTTIDTDVLEGLHAARQAAVSQLPSHVEPTQTRVCSSAGGGLRLAVIGNEPLVTATAAHRAGLSAGARVVDVAAGEVTAADWEAMATTRPDVLLLAGGTDGGDATVLRRHAHALAAAAAGEVRLQVPVVLAGNNAAAAAVSETLAAGGMDVVTVDNVLPRVGQLRPGPARAALREAFLKHVIAGKRLSAGGEFASMVHAATPDAVLAGVELLADGDDHAPGAGDLVVVDVGGATTDVYSVLTPDAELTGPRREVAGHAWRSRTVEGDLGMRHTAVGVVAAGASEGLLEPDEADDLQLVAETRAQDPGFVSDSRAERDRDLRLAELAVTAALRRHARGERLGGPDAPLRGGKDLRQVRLIVGSGGVLRHHGEAARRRLRQAASDDTAGGYPLPENPAMRVDTSYVLAAAGLLAPDHSRAALRLLREHLMSPVDQQS